MSVHVLPPAVISGDELAHARRIVNVFGGIVVAAWGGFAPTDRVAAGVAALGDERGTS